MFHKFARPFLANSCPVDRLFRVLTGSPKRLVHCAITPVRAEVYKRVFFYLPPLRSLVRTRTFLFRHLLSLLRASLVAFLTWRESVRSSCYRLVLTRRTVVEYRISLASYLSLFSPFASPESGLRSQFSPGERCTASVTKFLRRERA